MKNNDYVTPIIAPFSLFSLTDNNFKWLHPEAWRPQHLAFFAEQRTHIAEQKLLMMQNHLKNGNPSATLGGRWILCTRDSDAPQAWLELHCFHKYFSRSIAYVSALASGARWDEAFYKRAISRLLSAIFIATDCDQIQLTGVTSIHTQLPSLEFGDTRVGFSTKSSSSLFSRRFSPPALPSFPFVCVEAQVWWEKELAVQDRESLAYLVKRVQAQRRLSGAKFNAPKKSKFSLLKILLGRR